MNLAGQLEKMIDSHGLKEVLKTLGHVVYDKGEHIAINWQDYRLANSWMRSSSKIMRVAAKLPKIAGLGK